LPENDKERQARIEDECKKMMDEYRKDRRVHRKCKQTDCPYHNGKNHCSEDIDIATGNSDSMCYAFFVKAPKRVFVEFDVQIKRKD
jgi:hypothetical protein|tara:strand:- start:4826 stop:5083 length:258 start_codon:yes stop_codon:yes gene_type:complete